MSYKPVTKPGCAAFLLKRTQEGKYFESCRPSQLVTLSKETCIQYFRGSCLQRKRLIPIRSLIVGGVRNLWRYEIDFIAFRTNTLVADLTEMECVDIVLKGDKTRCYTIVQT